MLTSENKKKSHFGNSYLKNFKSSEKSFELNEKLQQMAQRLKRVI